MHTTHPILQLTFLGTGTSAGVPLIGCHCPVCSSKSPYDKRLRSSALVQWWQNDANLRTALIDCGPDLRQQALRCGMEHLDGVFITHAHVDHVVGLDELRRFNTLMNGPLDLLAEGRVLESLHQMFAHIFDSSRNVNPGSYVAQFIPHMLTPGRTITWMDCDWTPLRLMHGRLPIVGYRIEHAGHAMAYLTDCNAIPPETWPLLANLDVLIIDALRPRHHPTHFTTDQALINIAQIQPKEAFLIHMSHDLSHEELGNRLPNHVHAAHDGMQIQIHAGGSIRIISA
jgi:phosphoribosyl 1,2-cyclic phosphate phosphodiesterase